MSTFHVSASVDQVLTELADFIVITAKNAIAQNGRFSFVLSGGSSPKRLHELLASDLYKNKIEWGKVFFFFGDERNVPADHKDSNYLMAKKTLFEPLNIPAAQVFRMNTDLAPEAAAQAYQNEVLTYFAGQPTSFDLILLGLGDNSHTASLFPHTSVLHEKEALVKGLYIEEVKMFRITLTAPLINQAKEIAYLVFGEGKALAVRHIIEDERNIEEYPAQLITAEKGALHWFMDTAAASALTKKH